MELPVAPVISLYFSADGGASWEKRLDNLTEAVGGANILPLKGCGLISHTFSTLEGRFTPVDYISFAYITWVGGSTGSVYRHLVSGDGGHSFNEVGADNIPTITWTIFLPRAGGQGIVMVLMIATYLLSPFQRRVGKAGKLSIFPLIRLTFQPLTRSSHILCRSNLPTQRAIFSIHPQNGRNETGVI